MALHDVDKSGADRSSPLPNSHDEQGIPRQAHGTNSVNYHTDASPSSSGGQILTGNAQLITSGVLNHPISIPSSGKISIDTSTVAHNLGYAPWVVAFMNNTMINGSGAYNIPLPIMPSLGVTAADTIAPIVWMFASSDVNNVYVISYTTASAAVPATYEVTYYLYRQPTS